jgi:hypothetical protein
MDYGFAPGKTLQDGRARRLFTRRADTTLIQRKNLSTLKGFINRLNTAAGIARPVGDILLGSHANEEGFLFVNMFPGQRGATKFETLESCIANAARSIEIPNALIDYTPGDPVTAFFHIKGCNIGMARPFLVKLREALGDNVTVTAPKHFHFIFFHTSYGVWESMDYQYRIIQPDAFANRAAAVTAFENAGFEDIDGNPVPPANWGKWAPKKIDRTSKIDVPTKLGVTIGDRKTIPCEREFRFKIKRFHYTIVFPTAGNVPSSQADREAALEQSLNNDPGFASSHDFPEYERWGYSDIPDFIAGYNWVFQPKKRRLICTGSRHEYTVIVSVLNTATGNLIFNFHPNAGSPLAAITTGMVESDARLFESV